MSIYHHSVPRTINYKGGSYVLADFETYADYERGVRLLIEEAFHRCYMAYNTIDKLMNTQEPYIELKKQVRSMPEYFNELEERGLEPTVLSENEMYAIYLESTESEVVYTFIHMECIL